MAERGGYLEGVPLRLIAKYYPRPRVQFKEIDIHIPVDALLQDDYDFSMERRVLFEVKQWDEEKERVRKIKEEIERRKAEEEAEKAEEEENRIKEEAKKVEEAKRWISFLKL